MTRLPALAPARAPSELADMNNSQWSRYPTSDIYSGYPLPSLEAAVGPNPFELVPKPGSEPVAQIPQVVIPGSSQLFFDDKPVVQYEICGLRYNMEQPVNETKSEFRRLTVGGQSLRYNLEVIQQPEKARACGAGPRSSADRRPVDPPPVVRLNIFNEATNEDITMHYEANFMLYASLEIARPIANGRMHAGPPLAVLTGVAVASTAYLDRPQQAGYFIFPDLSVRHEGWYRLKFSLFESIKHAVDADISRPFSGDDGAATGQAPVMHESMANRMEVQSTPFQVFSAKKFPGLNMSTNLSRVVAEQGCRVRIRREIRQRKRNADKPDVSDDGPSSYQGTPQPSYSKPDHIRTASRNSIDAPYIPQPVRRPSNESTYARPPPPSRQPSIASMTMPSPLTPGSAIMPMAPPSSFNIRPSVETSPISANYSSQYSDNRSYQTTTPTHTAASRYPQILSTESDSSVTLPPIQQKYNPVGYNSVSRQYNLPEPSASKRSYSPQTYDQKSSMKLGARPDAVPKSIPSFNPANAGGIIEADSGDDSNTDDSLLEGDYTYPRADGSRGTKVALGMRRSLK